MFKSTWYGSANYLYAWLNTSLQLNTLGYIILIFCQNAWTIISYCNDSFRYQTLQELNHYCWFQESVNFLFIGRFYTLFSLKISCLLRWKTKSFMFTSSEKFCEQGQRLGSKIDKGCPQNFSKFENRDKNFENSRRFSNIHE